MNGIIQALSIRICDDPAEAIAAGYNYRSPETLPIDLEKVVVVKNGTVEGKPTVDFLLRDENGQQYVFMITGALLKSILIGENP